MFCKKTSLCGLWFTVREVFCQPLFGFCFLSFNDIVLSSRDLCYNAVNVLL